VIAIVKTLVYWALTLRNEYLRLESRAPRARMPERVRFACH
jgi:hypothetical protein